MSSSRIVVTALHQLPAVDPHKTFATWCTSHGKHAVGEVVYARFFQQPVVILNSAQAVYDLLEKRGFRPQRPPPTVSDVNFREIEHNILYTRARRSNVVVVKEQVKTFRTTTSIHDAGTKRKGRSERFNKSL
ncbi:uncharacterized protein C8Q71DRAFT_859600 [Rhodofomes roseus]|uniref:Uncharacterized protein n=1 Tax=Rhodofomes roseus TaxID=34475 RepID=A0ABQ8KB55_9APHY|nr:uncharacterized protein C8Q71DRAFT_859600 [Rhodofomes roseus]KAH9834634.1 hypothetical protein C8Q71DRAFT_859600 [Rhodofomes roseus]